MTADTVLQSQPHGPQPRSAVPAIELRGVGRRIGEATVLADVNLEVAPGTVCHLVGPSGAGKSTLLRLVNRLDEPDAGTVAVFGRDLRAWPVRELRRRVAFVFQEPSLLGRTVRENLALPFQLHGRLPLDFEARAAEVLRWMALDTGFLERHEDDLSVGQKQRVALARALVAGPEVLLLDEPTAGLDQRTAEELLDRLGALNRERGLTLLLSTHRLAELRRLGGTMAVIMAGQIRAVGPVADVLAHSPDAEVAEFLRDPDAPPAVAPEAEEPTP